MATQFEELPLTCACGRARRQRSRSRLEAVALRIDRSVQPLTRSFLRLTLALGAICISSFLIAVLVRVLVFFWWKLNTSLS